MWTHLGILDTSGIDFTMYFQGFFLFSYTLLSFHNFECAYPPIKFDLIKIIHSVSGLPVPWFERLFLIGIVVFTQFIILYIPEVWVPLISSWTLWTLLLHSNYAYSKGGLQIMYFAHFALHKKLRCKMITSEISVPITFGAKVYANHQ